MSFRDNFSNIISHYLNHLLIKNCRIVTVLLFAFVLLLVSFLKSAELRQIPRVDFLQYYSAAKLLSLSQNPYSPELIKATEHEIYPAIKPVAIYMYNPPIVIPLIYLLQSLKFETAKAVWSALSVTSILISILILSKLFNIREKFLIYMSTIFIATFEPFYSILFFGQISFLLLVGFVVHLYFIKNANSNFRNYLYSGMALGLLLIKPHMLIVYLGLLFLMLNFKQFLIVMLGVLFTLVVCSGFAVGIRPSIFTEYFEFISNPPIFWQTATIGSWLQYFTDIHRSWIRMLPSILAFLVLVLIKLSKKNITISNRDLVLLSPLAFVLAPYVWVFDYVLLLPAVFLIFKNLGRVIGIKKIFGVFSLFLLGFFGILIPDSWGQQWFVYYPVGVFLIGWVFRLESVKWH